LPFLSRYCLAMGSICYDDGCKTRIWRIGYGKRGCLIMKKKKRGRPRKEASERLVETVSLRLSQDEIALLRQMAADEKTTLSNLVRNAVFDKKETK